MADPAAQTAAATGPKSGSKSDPKHPADPGQSIGQVLSGARLAAELTVEQVGVETSVRVPIIQAIERDDFSRCGGDFYARGHIRALARAVRADGDRLVAAYDDAHGGTPVATRPLPMLEAERLRPERRRANWTGAMVLATVVVVSVIGFNMVDGRSRNTAAVTTIVPRVRPTLAAKPVTVPKKPAAKPAQAAPKAVSLKVSADGGDSWLQVTNAAGQTLFRDDLVQGATQTFTDAKQLSVVFGDAGAVHLWVNGKDVGKPGDEGQVVNADATLKGLQTTS
ncbi:helix-turn-helix domain-containing protein [Streptacidiphilus sp. 4-A2]|nr:helix-turn-helix domain-containing protein [Streptacidiphilus sp. 4-A2]